MCEVFPQEDMTKRCCSRVLNVSWRYRASELGDSGKAATIRVKVYGNGRSLEKLWWCSVGEAQYKH